MKNNNREMVLALYPNRQGFGYAFLEKLTEPRDCGVVTIRPISNHKCLERIKKFIEYYQPTLIILEDPEGKTSWKSLRVKKLIYSITDFCQLNNITVKKYSREQIRFVFSEFNVKSKYEIAAQIIKWLPQFKNKMPEVRKPWMCQDYNMVLFDALSLAITHFYLTE
ncbi:MAG: hypothetical protein POELPBGB_01414 [Bacteroidia bacterium]|nr:hypothetical protein [Bacteroidia bacterium]